MLNLELAESPDHPFTLFNLGMTYRDARDYDKAIDFLERSIARSGEGESHLRYLTRHNLAIAYIELGNIELAEEQWKLARAESPRFRPAWRGLGSALIRQRKLNEAAALIDCMRGDEHLACDAMLLQSEFALARGDRNDAWRLLEEAVTAHPDDAEPLRALSKLVLDHASPADAEPVLRRLAELDPEDASAQHNLATVRLRMGRYEDAAAAYRASLRVRPHQASTWMQLGYALKSLGDGDGAAAAFGEVVRLSPEGKLAREAHVHLHELGR